MKCAYHPINLASVHCSSCGRNLCPACDHRIKGFPYCQDCIVAGIGLLRRDASNGQYAHARGGEKRPFVAFLLGLVPGLGAAYNGQPIKALVHFVATMGLGMMTDIFASPLAPIAALATLAFYLYSLYDAYHSAQRGSDELKAEDESLKVFLRERTNLWGGLLIGVGLLSMLNFFLPYQFRHLWPLLFVAGGLYFLNDYRNRRREPETKTGYRTPPPSVISSSYDRATNDFTHAERRFDR
jgi:TM2 domain-containing membrane protein YozV